MDSTFKIRKTDKKHDLINFVQKVCEWDVKLDDKNLIVEIGKTPVFITFGKTYIRIQDCQDEPDKITQLFYDTDLDSEKYAVKIKDVVESSVRKVKEERNISVVREKYSSLFKDFAAANKYTYEPYTIDNCYIGEELFALSSENNFTLEIYLNSKKQLSFAPQINKKIIHDLSPVSVDNHKTYINIVDATIKKIEKLKKVMALIINDINKVVEVNISK